MTKEEVINIAKQIPGTAGRPDYIGYIYDMAQLLPENCRILEIGAMVGGSASAWALSIKDKGGLVYSIEPGFMKDKTKYPWVLGNLYAYMRNIITSGAEGFCIPLPGSSEEVLKRWHGKVLFDLVFIDGHHVYDAVKIDMQWLQHTKPAAFCFFDDWLPGIEKACAEYMKDHPEWVNLEPRHAMKRFKKDLK